MNVIQFEIQQLNNVDLNMYCLRRKRRRKEIPTSIVCYYYQKTIDSPIEFFIGILENLNNYVLTSVLQSMYFEIINELDYAMFNKKTINVNKIKNMLYGLK